MTTPGFNLGFGQELFAEDPQMGFLGYLANQGIGEPKRRFLRSRWQNIYDLFREGQAGQLNQGILPTSSFTTDFLPQFNLEDYRRRFSPDIRGEGVSGLAPRARFHFRYQR